MIYLPMPLAINLPDRGKAPYANDRKPFFTKQTFTAAQIHAGAKVLVPTLSIPEKVVLLSMLAVVSGGAITGPTGLKISTQDTTPLDVVTIAVAALTDGAQLNLSSANVVITAANWMAGTSAGYVLKEYGGTAAGGSINILCQFGLFDA